MFDILEEFQESLNKMKGMLAIRKEKVCNLISNLLEKQRKVQIILPEIQKVFDKYPKIILKGDQNIRNCNLVKHEIYFEYNKLIKSLL